MTQGTDLNPDSDPDPDPANERYDIWRYDSRDDYTGEGLEKPKSILKPI